MKAPCTLKDLLPIEQAQQVVDWFDTRPLTNETLKELGFEKVYTNEYHYKDLVAWMNLDDDTYYVPIKFPSGMEMGLELRKEITTVGSVKMLIEALKGDE